MIPKPAFLNFGASSFASFTKASLVNGTECVAT
jgi:hypothetical protein